MKSIEIKLKDYTICEIGDILEKDLPITLSSEVINTVNRSRFILEEKVRSGATIYGVNTGFGKLSQVKISENDIMKLQENLILSHAVGMGKPVPGMITKMILLLKVISLSKGSSGVRLIILQRLLDFLNQNCLPVIPEQGSVGASGDLAPLAHMTLPLIGKGKVIYEDKIHLAEEILGSLDLNPISLSYKEGLALINGTQFSTSYGLYCSLQAGTLVKSADIIGAMTVDGLKGTNQAFREDIHSLKPQIGQKKSAKNLWNLLENSEILTSHSDCGIVQDLYSLRCMPQVHGASRNTLEYFNHVIETEINSVSDNPLVMQDTGEIISAGHFHAQAVGQAMDCAAIAMTTLGTISERRTYAMVNGDFELPAFLTKSPGINSGFMILQITAAALASENKSLSTPSTIDSIPTGAGQEDHVSMAPWAGRKLYQIIENVTRILGIECLTASQAIDFRENLKTSPALEIARNDIRLRVPLIDSDRLMDDDLLFIEDYLKQGKLVGIVEDRLKLQ